MRKRNAKDTLPQYFYIARGSDRSLCGGVGASYSVCNGSIPIWREPGDYEWARRFSTVEKAMEYAVQNNMFGVLIVDRSGTIYDARSLPEVK